MVFLTMATLTLIVERLTMNGVCLQLATGVPFGTIAYSSPIVIRISPLLLISLLFHKNSSQLL